MENNEFKKVHIKNRTCYYFNDIIKSEYFDPDNILIDQKSHESLIDLKPLHIRFDKIDGFCRVYYVTRYLILLGSEKYDAIYDRIRYLKSKTSAITYSFSHYFAKMKVESYDFLPIEKRFTLHNVVIHLKSVLNKDKNHYYYKISYQLPEK